jgi:putative SOS response-associated peptidase YedK
MCGRYALSLRPSQVRQRLADQNMPAEDAPDDDDDQVRPTYNFAPGYHGLIYRAATSDRGGDAHPPSSQDHNDTDEPSPKRIKRSHDHHTTPTPPPANDHTTHYRLQTAKWGLIPFWTKRPPDSGSQLRTINCRDDSLMENRGMWNTMKQRKRCTVVAEGFYEWLKKNNGKEKIPHFTKRKDGQLMCFAGLWDMVQYEGGEEKLYTYTIITTDSNKQLRFLHDRMPAILEPGSEEMKAWLDPKRVGWDDEFQSMLKPFRGELECYPVDQGVGKVGNNSHLFVVPVDSKENKKNIANFFGKQRETAGEVAKKHREAAHKAEKEDEEDRTTSTKVADPESNAPLPKPKDAPGEDLSQAIKAEKIDDKRLESAAEHAVDESVEKSIKREMSDLKAEELIKAAESPPQKKQKLTSSSPTKNPPAKTASPASNRKPKSATKNQHNTTKSPVKKDGNARITSFFGK